MNLKKIISALLTVLGTGGLICAGVLLVNASEGTYVVKTLATFGIFGFAFFISATSLVRTAKKEMQ